MQRSLCYWSEDLIPPKPPTTSLWRYSSASSPWPIAALVSCLLIVPSLCLCLGYDFSTSRFYLICSGFDNLILFQTLFTLRCGPGKARAISPCCLVKKLFHGRSTFLRAVRPVPALGGKKICWRNFDSEASFQTDIRLTKTFIVNIFSWYPTKGRLQ